MTKPMIRIHNIEINEIVDREMTNAEIAELEASRAVQIAPELTVAEKLASVGLSIDDLKVALGV